MSPEHRAKISAARSGPGQRMRLCAYCSRPFAVSKPSRHTRFCSRACQYINRSGPRARNWKPDMPVIPCFVCGKPVRFHAVGAKRLTCSYSCKGIWLKSRQPTFATNIEKIVQSALVRRGWPFLPQYPIPGICVADFYLAQIKATIFCDGDYWHGLPEHREKDRRQEMALRALGYRVYRFTGTEILHDVETCLDLIPHPQILHTVGK